MVEKIVKNVSIGLSGLERNIGNVARIYLHHEFVCDDRTKWYEGIIQKDELGFYIISSRPVRITDGVTLNVYYMSGLERLYDVALR